MLHSNVDYLTVICQGGYARLDRLSALTLISTLPGSDKGPTENSILQYLATRSRKRSADIPVPCNRDKIRWLRTIVDSAITVPELQLLNSAPQALTQLLDLVVRLSG